MVFDSFGPYNKGTRGMMREMKGERTMNETIGNRIARLRKEKRLSQEALAEKLGVSPQAVSKWENDQSCPDISLLPALAGNLEVSVDELLTGHSDQVKMLPQNQRKPLEELTLRVRILSGDGDKIRVNLPMPLVKVCMEIGLDMAPGVAGDKAELLKGIDLRKIVELVEQGLVGKLVEIESADGDVVEVEVE